MLGKHKISNNSTFAEDKVNRIWKAQQDIRGGIINWIPN